MNQLLVIVILIIILIIVLIIKKNYTVESFKNNNDDNDKYLYPVKGLTPICAEEGLFPSFMPKACYLDGKMNSYANCKCEDDKGICKICYPTIKRDKTGSNVVFDSTKGTSG